MTSSRKTPSTGPTAKSPKIAGGEALYNELLEKYFPPKKVDWSFATSTTSSTTWWPWSPDTGPDLDDEQLEALIGTIVDSIVARALGPGGGDFPQPLEPKSAGFLYLREGTGVTPTIWRSEPLGGSTNTTYWSSSSEGFFTLSND